MLDYTKKVLHADAVEALNKADISNVSADYQATLGLIGCTTMKDEEKTQKNSNGLEDYSQALNTTGELIQRMMHDRELFPGEIREIKEAEETVHKTLVCAFQNNASPAQIVCLYWELGTIAAIRSDVKLANIYIKALEPYLSQLPMNEQPWLPFKKAFDLVQEKGLQHQHFSYKLLEYKQLVDLEDTNEETEKGRTLLSWAAEKGHSNVVKQQIEVGADIESSIDTGHHCEAKVELKDRYDRSMPLMWAARRGHSAIIKHLLDSGAAVDSNNTGNSTPLMWTVWEGHSAVVDHFLKAGAAIDSKNGSGLTVLLIATDMSHSAMVKQLLEAGADPESRCSAGLAALHKAAKSGNEDLVQHLLKAGAKVGSTDNWGRTPLMWTTKGGNAAVTKQLLEARADFGVKSIEGVIALHAAAISGNKDIIKQLLEVGANIMSEDSEFRTPRWYADNLGYENIAKLL